MEENKVFISYSHDSIEHVRNVMNLCQRLRSQGIDCMIDQFVTSPDEGWPLWMERQFEESEFVLVVCTYKYHQRVVGKQSEGTGLGARWEGHLTLQHLYNNGALNKKFIPILMGEGKVSFIPRPLQSATRYRPQTEDDYERLYRHLTHQPLYEKITLGEKKTLPSLQVIGDFIEENQSIQGFNNVNSGEFKGSYQAKSSIEYRHLTGLNSYPVLALSEKYIPKELTDILGIEGQPIINTDNVVFKNLENFIIESGNLNLIHKKYHPLSGVQFSYAVHNSGHTKKGRSDYMRNLSRQEEFNQNSNDFFEDTVQYTSECQEFEFSPILVPFQNSQEDLEWTSITVDQYNSDNGDIFQYPKFSAINREGFEDFFCYSHTSDMWIKKILNNNPDVRGFFLYQYQYTQTPENYPRGCGGVSIRLISRMAPAPYIRFIEIKNTSEKVIKIKSVNFKILEQNPYQLTNVDNRTNLFDVSEIKTEHVNIDLKPNQHLLLLTEFGFDTKIHNRSSSSQISRSKNKNLDGQESQKIFIYRQPKTMPSQDFNDNLLNRYTNYSETEDLNNENPLYDVVVLNENFLGQTKSLETLMPQNLRRFAVGSIIDIASIECDTETVLIDPPRDLDAFYISQYFAYGSCPYLLVYNQEKGYWVEIGTVLYGRDAENLNDFEIYSIPPGITKIKIEERDPEITYLTYLSVLMYSRSSNSLEREIFPDLKGNFNHLDNYFSLQQGDYVEFDLPKENDFEIKLKLKGYYEILNPVEV